MRPAPALQRIPDIAQGECVQLGLTVNSQTNNNTLIITAEQAEVIQKRNTAMDEEVAQLGEAYLAKRGLASGTNGGQIREVETTLVANAAIALPPPTGRQPNGWAMLSRGDGTRPITPEAAINLRIRSSTVGNNFRSGALARLRQQLIPSYQFRTNINTLIFSSLPGAVYECAPTHVFYQLKAQTSNSTGRVNIAQSFRISMRKLRNGTSCSKYPTTSATKRCGPGRRRVRSSSCSQASSNL